MTQIDKKKVLQNEVPDYLFFQDTIDVRPKMLFWINGLFSGFVICRTWTWRNKNVFLMKGILKDQLGFFLMKINTQNKIIIIRNVSEMAL